MNILAVCWYYMQRGFESSCSCDRVSSSEREGFLLLRLAGNRRRLIGVGASRLSPSERQARATSYPLLPTTMWLVRIGQNK